MVLHKRSEYGFHGYQIPTMPRGCRSSRKKRPIRYNAEVCAMDLLATVAGKLLLEKENPGGCPGPLKAKAEAEAEAEEIPWTEPKAPIVGLAAAMPPGGYGVDGLTFKTAAAVLSAGPVHSPAMGIEPSHSPKTEEEEEEMKAGVDGMRIIKVGCDRQHVMSTEEGSMDLELKTKPENSVRPPPLGSSDSSVEGGSGRLMPRSSSFPRFRDKSLNYGDEDGDDGKSSACTHPSSVSSRAAASFRPQRIVDRRIRKLLSSRLWRVGAAPLNIKDGEIDERELLRSKKLCYRQQKTCFKRKKVLDGKMESKVSCDYNKKKCIKGGEQVNLKIKSFKVPELLIEMPETATVGSLKRAVLETVTAMLGKGLKVGIIYQGRKVRDDSRSLVQAGITGGDSLNFSLEPKGATVEMAHGSTCSSWRPVEQCRSPRPLAARLPVLLEIRNGGEQEQQWQQKALGLASPTATGWENKSGKAHNDSPIGDASGSGAIVPVSSAPSKALVPIHPPPCSSSELAVAVVPASNKAMGTRVETAQRRIRRPFSVAEVEALVQAVETLGTGRWRDVKLQAFENAKHRTYVDLKDKWKTLVHTARISPQQRRGQPVPQELLDRVLVAHAHWSQHQPRLQSSKHAANASCGSSHQRQPPPNCASADFFISPPPPQTAALI